MQKIVLDIRIQATILIQAKISHLKNTYFNV